MDRLPQKHSQAHRAGDGGHADRGGEHADPGHMVILGLVREAWC